MTAVWYVAEAAPMMDVRVARDLGDQGYEAFAPKMFAKATVRLKDNNSKTGVASWLWLSPYVFVSVDEALRTKSGHQQSLRGVRETLGVSGIVSLMPDIGGQTRASVVPHSIIRHYRHLENADYEAAERRVRIKESAFYPNDRVVVVADCEFNGWEGTVKEIRHRLVVIEPTAGGWPLVLPEDDLALVGGVGLRHAS